MKAETKIILLLLVQACTIASAALLKGSWGPSQFGERGDNVAHSQIGPRALDSLVFVEATFAKVSGGGSEGYALTSDGDVYSWGLLYENNIYLHSEPFLVNMSKYGGGPLLDFAASTYDYLDSNHIAISATNEVWIQSYFDGIGDFTTRLADLSNVPQNLNFARCYARRRAIFLLATNGSVFAMGDNSLGQLGIGGTPARYDKLTPVDLSNLGEDRVVDISMGDDFTIFLTHTGQAYATGSNYQYQLGVFNSDSITSVDIPTLISSSINFTQICSTSTSSIGIGTDGMAYAWGYSAKGALGRGPSIDTELYPSPMWNFAFGEVGPRIVSNASCGDSHVIMLMTDGALFVTGDGSGGALGISPPRIVYNLTIMEPALFGPLFSTPQAVAAGKDWSGLLGVAGPQLYAWGSGLGAFGFVQGAQWTSAGSWFTSYWPLPISGKYIKVSTQYYHTLALTDTGQIESFGAGGSGQLGNGDKIDSYGPVSTNISSIVGSVTDVRAGLAYSLALTSDGAVYSWGESSTQCLGRIANEDSLIPDLVDTTGALAGKTVVLIAAGPKSVLVSTSDNLLFSWGEAGQYLGDGTVIGSPVPIEVVLGILSGKNITSIAVGDGHMMATADDGTTVAWGENDVGQLGVSDTVVRSFPTAINSTSLGTSVAVSVHASAKRSALVTRSGQLFIWGKFWASKSEIFAPTLYEWYQAIAHFELGETIALIVSDDQRLFQFGEKIYSYLPNEYVSSGPVESPVQVQTSPQPYHQIYETFSLSVGRMVSFFVGNMTMFASPPLVAPLSMAPIAPMCNGFAAPSSDPVWLCVGSVWTLDSFCQLSSCNLSSTTIVAAGSTVRFAGENLSNLTIYVQGTLSFILGSNPTQLGCIVMDAPAASIRISVPSSAENGTKIFSFDKTCSNFAVSSIGVDLTDDQASCSSASAAETQDSPTRSSVSVLFSLSSGCNEASFNAGAVAGGVIGALAVASAAAVFGFLLRRRAKAKKTAHLDDVEDAEMAAVPSAAAQIAPSTQGANPSLNRSSETEYSAIAAKSQSISNSLQSLEIIPAGSVKLVHLLGAGSFGRVHLGLYGSTFVAVKELINPTVEKLESFLEEANIHFQLQPDPFVCKMYGVMIDISATQYSIVVEYCANGSLHDSRNLIKVDDEYAMFRIIYGVAKGMTSVAASSIVHRDLAARNILLDEQLFPKIADLGMARKLEADENVGVTNANVGPIAWMSPENFHREYSEKSDVWSFAQMIVELITKQTPFFDFNGSLVDLAVAISQGEVDPLQGLEQLSIPEWIFKLLQACFERKPDNRPSFKRVCKMLKSLCPAMVVRFENDLDDATSVLRPSESPLQHYSHAGVLLETGDATKRRGNRSKHASKSTKRALTLHSATAVASESVKRLGLLGTGSFGEVYLGKLKSKFVAIKRLTDSSGSKISLLLKEAELMMKATPHRNMVQLYGIHLVEEDSTSDRVVEIIMEFVSRGSLEGYVRSTVDPNQGNTLSSSLIYRFLLGISRGMASLASDRLVHRDLAARNILLDAYLEPKVSDFGFARELVENIDQGETKSEIGPIRWMAPECLSTKTYSEQSDVWAFGCVVLEMLLADVPFSDLSLVETVLRVRDDKMSPLDYHMDKLKAMSVDDYIVQLLEMIFKYDASKRPSFADIVTFLEQNAPSDVLKAEQRRARRREKREKLLSAIDEIAL